MSSKPPSVASENRSPKGSGDETNQTSVRDARPGTPDPDKQGNTRVNTTT